MKNTKQTSGRIGGLATVKKYGPEHMAAIGKRGAVATWKKYRLVPLNQSQYAMVDRKTNELKAIR